jgi:hypothetical protein
LIGAIDFFQTKAREAAGVVQAATCFGCWVMTSFYDEFDEEK